MSFCVVLCHYVENGFAGYCIFASVNKRNRVGATYGECTFSTRSALVKVWRTTSDHRVLNVHSSNKPQDSTLQSTKILNSTKIENYGNSKKQQADASKLRQDRQPQGLLLQGAVYKSTAFGNLSAFLRRGEGWDIRQEQRKGVKWENERENNGDGEILGEKIVKKEIIHFFFLTLPPSFAMTPIV